MHFSRKSRPREFNTTGDRVQRIDNITTFLHLATNKCSLCRSTCATLSSDHASVIPTHDISRFWRSCRLSTWNTIRCVLHVSCHHDSERVAPWSDLFICERRSSWCVTGVTLGVTGELFGRLCRIRLRHHPGTTVTMPKRMNHWASLQTYDMPICD